jgi:hypothetical protein
VTASRLWRGSTVETPDEDDPDEDVLPRVEAEPVLVPPLLAEPDDDVTNVEL